MIFALVFLIRSFIQGSLCTLKPSLLGKVAIVTGSNTGIGFETALYLAKCEANVILACRNESKALRALNKIKKEVPEAQVHFIPLDLSDFSSIKKFKERFSEKFLSLDVLINNAGIMNTSKRTGALGLEEHFVVNHLGPFYLTQLLLPLLSKSQDARVVNVSSQGAFYARLDLDDLCYQRNKYFSFLAYADSKLANVLHADQLVKRHGSSSSKGLKGILAVSVHPGVVRTQIIDQVISASRVLKVLSVFLWIFLWVLMKDEKHGATATLHLALAPREKLVNGGFYTGCKLATKKTILRRQEKGEKLWEISEKLVQMINTQ